MDREDKEINLQEGGYCVRYPDTYPTFQELMVNKDKETQNEVNLKQSKEKLEYSQSL